MRAGSSPGEAAARGPVEPVTAGDAATGATQRQPGRWAGPRAPSPPGPRTRKAQTRTGRPAAMRRPQFTA